VIVEPEMPQQWPAGLGSDWTEAQVAWWRVVLPYLGGFGLPSSS